MLFKPNTQLSFRDTVNARLVCSTGENCNNCPLSGNKCNEVDLAGNVNRWLKYILDVLDSTEQDIEDISADDFANDWLNILG